MDPKYAQTVRKPNSRDRMSQLQLNHYRLNPVDGVLEFRVNIHFALLWVPYLPDGKCALVKDREVTWKRWAFDHAHQTFVSPHRSAAATYQYLRRMCYWPHLAVDCDKMYAQCETCIKIHSHPVQGPFRSMLADDTKSVLLPWEEVVIDCQGPFTKSEGGINGSSPTCARDCGCLS